MNTQNPKVEYKSTQLISILSEIPAGKMNLARIKFFGMFLCALCKVQTVCFEKLFTVVMLAFTWAYLAGVFVNDYIKPVGILKHGRRAKSLLKYGLEFIARILFNPLASDCEIDIFEILSCT